jgi:hypothetical protein
VNNKRRKYNENGCGSFNRNKKAGSETLEIIYTFLAE